MYIHSYDRHSRSSSRLMHCLYSPAEYSPGPRFRESGGIPAGQRFTENGAGKWGPAGPQDPVNRRRYLPLPASVAPPVCPPYDRHPMISLPLPLSSLNRPLLSHRAQWTTCTSSTTTPTVDHYPTWQSASPGQHYRGILAARTISYYA